MHAWRFGHLESFQAINSHVEEAWFAAAHPTLRSFLNEIVDSDMLNGWNNSRMSLWTLTRYSELQQGIKFEVDAIFGC